LTGVLNVMILTKIVLQSVNGVQARV